MKNKKYYLFSFFLPIVIVLLSLLITNKLENEAFIISDMKNQYIGFFSYLKNIDSFSDLFYSFSKGLGGAMLPDFFYYLSSPLNLLIFLPFKLITNINLIIILKFGICGLTSYLFFKTKTKEKYALIFSMCYSLSAYMINFYFNTMWIDAIYMLPLITLGIDKLIYNNKSNFYIITLFLSILFNYYITFSTCIFLLLYFFYETIINKNLTKKLLCKFILSSIIAALLSSFIIIPIIVNIINVNRPIDFQSLNSFKDILEGMFVFVIKLFPCTNNVNTIEGVFTFNIYSSLISLILFILFFFNNKINKKEKILTLIFLLIFILSFLLNPLSFVWHGFSYPSAFFFRFSYLYTFFVILIAAKQIKYISETKHIIFTFIILCIFLIICYFYNSLYNSNFIYLSLLFIILYLFIINLKNRMNNKTFFSFILIITVLELFINCSTSFITKKEYQKQKDFFPQKINENKTYLRTSKDPNYSFNDDFIYNRKGTMYSSSNISKNIKAFYYKIGAYSTSTSVYLNNDNKIIYNLLGINNGSLGYQTNKLDKLKYKNQFDYQNKIIKNITKSNREVFSIINLNKTNDHTYETLITTNDDLYLSIDINFKDYVYKYNIGNIYINDKLITTIDNFKHNFGIIKINNEYKNKNIKIKIELNNENININNIVLAHLNSKEYNNYINYLNNNKINVITLDNKKLEGNINIKNNNYLFTSIPYDRNWHVYVDNKKINIEKVFDTFIGIKLDKGFHNIKMIYIPKDFILGIIISISTLSILILYKKTRN